jgi:hypothetical protein
MTDTEMEAALRNIEQMSAVVYAKEPHWKRQKMELAAPAVTRKIAQFSKRLPVPLPPSYVQFVRLHDGGLNVWPTWTLLGTADTPRVVPSLKKTGVVFAHGEDGDFLAFNLKNKGRDGDYEVLHYTEHLSIEDRYPSLAAFLGTTAYLLQTRILDKGYSAAPQRRVGKEKVKGV